MHIETKAIEAGIETMATVIVSITISTIDLKVEEGTIVIIEMAAESMVESLRGLVTVKTAIWK